MLVGYFDDSGTHADADITLWGGALGDTEQFEALVPKWRELLKEPLPGKPPLSSFHAAHLANSWKEFSSYRPAERDLTFKAFRDLVIEAKLVPVCFAISLADWHDVWGGPVSELFGTAEQFAFLSCVMSASRMSTISRGEVRFTFDQDRLPASRQQIIDGAREAMSSVNAEFVFDRVGDNIGLQIADLVAYESLLHALMAVKNTSHDPRPHFRRLLEGVPAAYGFLLSRHEIEELEGKVQRILDGDGQMTRSEPDRGFDNVYAPAFRGRD